MFKNCILFITCIIDRTNLPESLKERENGGVYNWEGLQWVLGPNQNGVEGLCQLPLYR